MLKTVLSILVFSILSFSFFSCEKINVYEQTKFFSNHSWSSNDTLQFSFEITDTTSPYNIQLVLRHHDAYRYKNIWVNMQVKDADTSFTVKREFILADNTKWLGTTMDDIVDQRIPFSTTAFPLKKGTYTFTLKQIMREDPLEHILAAGLRVEKQNP